ncbi:MAG: plastocyanin/azurin family copper-binding protein [Candidatus Woesearchaeota archaeon]
MKKYFMMLFTMTLLMSIFVAGCTMSSQTTDPDDNIQATENENANNDITDDTDKANQEMGETDVDDMMNDNNMIENNMDDETSGSVKTFKITGVNFDFMMDGETAPDIRVNHGNTVIIEFTSTDGFHDWVVDEFDSATEQVSTGESTSVEFIADQRGTFEYYCSVGNHRQMGMVGNLIVE